MPGHHALSITLGANAKHHTGAPRYVSNHDGPSAIRLCAMPADSHASNGSMTVPGNRRCAKSPSIGSLPNHPGGSWESSAVMCRARGLQPGRAVELFEFLQAERAAHAACRHLEAGLAALDIERDAEALRRGAGLQ